MRIKECEPYVEAAMETWPLCRDSNEALIVAVYQLVLGDDELMKMPFMEAMKWIYENRAKLNLPAITSIIRNRSVVQNKRIDLRGKDYEKNHKNKNKVKEDLGYGK